MHGQDNWREKAACKGQDPNLYIPEKKHSRDTIHYDKTTCMSCPVQQQCLEYALKNRAKKGLWGGTTPKERDPLYHLYKDEREYELDLQRILFPRRDQPRDIPLADDLTENPHRPLRDLLADHHDIYPPRSQEISIQGTLFEIEPWTQSA